MSGGRLQSGDFQLYNIDTDFAKGLGILTKAIYGADQEVAEPETIASAFKSYTGLDIDLAPMSIRERNIRLAALIRDAANTGGWAAGWNLLSKAAPDVGLHPGLVRDVIVGASVYARLRRGSRQRGPIDGLRIEIGPNATYDSIHAIGPKNIGGNAWKSSEEYAAVLRRPSWCDPGHRKGITPCVAYGWIAVQIKVIPKELAPDAMRLQMLSTIDYDLDCADANEDGFENGFQMGAQHALAKGTKLQAGAYVGMMSYDFQSFVRSVQNGWAAQSGLGWCRGPEDVSPEEIMATQSSDCAALMPFGFESADEYRTSRTGMIAGMVNLQCHDMVFDMGCGNRISSIAYCEAAGAGKLGMQSAFAVGFFEAVGQHFLDSLLSAGSSAEPVPYYGFAACMVAGPWDPFNTRYRAWERCIKYSRQLQRSVSSEAKAILDMTHQDLVLRDVDLTVDVGLEWARALKSTASDLVPRRVVKYFIPSIAMELFESPGVINPDLCAKCDEPFRAQMRTDTKEEIRAIPGLPAIVTACRAAGLAAGIRRAALWARSDACCDVCASRIGFWADATAYTVLSALMHDEPTVGPATWSLQNYFVGTVTFWPIGVPALLSGFDLVANLIYHDGAMGHRDVVDI